MTTTRRKRRPAEFRWPPYPVFTFYDGYGKILFRESDVSLDLSDTLMLHWPKNSRTVYLGLVSNGKSWSTWTEKHITHVESLINYDLRFDGYRVKIQRLTQRRWQSCKKEFLWKLQIRY